MGSEICIRGSAKTKEQDLEVVSVVDAVAQADVVMVLTPDQSRRAIQANDIEPNLKRDAAVFFAHSSSVHYGYIKSGPTHDVCMVVPKGPGHTVRHLLEEGCGVPSPVRVEQGASGRVFKLALSYVTTIDVARTGVIKTAFREETETDPFGEQVILCGGASQLIQYGFETLVEVGYQPKMAYFEVCHEMKLIVDLTNEGGLTKQRWPCSNTVEYGDYASGSRVIRPNVKDYMKEVLTDIQNGSFAKRFIDDQDTGVPEFLKLRARGMAHPIGKTGQEIRRFFA